MSNPIEASAARALAGEARKSAVYSVRLELFEGPLDLLLHLIRRNEVEITDIPIAEIARQYAEYLEWMREVNLDVAGEYLVLAATLAWIKSRMILPRDDDEDDAEEGDPRAELVARLLEYQRFKEAAGALDARAREGRDVFAAHSAELEATPDAEREIRVGLVQLVDAFRAVLQNAAPETAHAVDVETVSVQERMEAVMSVLATRETVEFTELFTTDGGALPGRRLLIATFLAMLELTRLAAIHIFQNLDATRVPEGPIRLRRAEHGDAWRGEKSAVPA